MFSFFALLLAFYITVVLIPFTNRLALRLGVMDVPSEGRKVHVQPTPRTGGIALAAGILAPAWIWLPMSPEMKAFFTGAGVIFVFGLLDDLFDLDYRKKFTGQIVAVCLTMAMGGFFIRDLGMWGGHEVVLNAWLGVPLTILFLVSTTNAINLADGLDGLAGGLCIIIFGAIGLLAYTQSSTDLAVCCLIIIGALLGFLRYNTFPATVFMGDTGSQLLGFSAGVLSLYLTQGESTSLARSLPLLIVGFPLLDMASVMVERMLEGQSPFKADKRHFHHRLLKMGGSQVASVVFIYVLQSAMVFFACYFRYYPEDWIAMIYLAIAAPLLLLLWISVRFGAHFGPLLSWGEGWVESFTTGRLGGMIMIGCLVVMKIVLSIGLPWLALSCEPKFAARWESGIFLLVGAMVVLSYWIRKSLFRRLMTYSLYLVGFFLMFATRGGELAFIHVPMRSFNYVFWGFLAAVLVIYLVVSKFKDLEASTVDYLLLLLVALVPFLPLEQVHEYHLGSIAGAMIVLLWVSEVVVRNQKRMWGLLALSSLVSLLLVGLKGLGWGIGS